MSERIPIKRALLSVSDKTGLGTLGAALTTAGVEIIASGGTSRDLRDRGVDVMAVADVTGAPEILGGRVKTLHPRIHGAILADTTVRDHMADLDNNGIIAIDLVVCNLYQFEAAVAAGKPTGEIVENIDIGGPAMIRAAAKNHKRVAVVTSPDEYDTVIAALGRGGPRWQSDADSPLKLSPTAAGTTPSFTIGSRVVSCCRKPASWPWKE